MEPTKSILVVALRNVARVEEFFRGMGIKIVNGSRYPGGFVRDKTAEDSCLAEKVQGCTELVKPWWGSPTSIHSLPTQDYRSHSNRSEH